MARKYTKVEHLAGIIKERKAAGETNRAIAESYGLTLKQVKKLITRQNRKERLLAAGYIPQPKGRPSTKSRYSAGFCNKKAKTRRRKKGVNVEYNSIRT